MSDQGASQGEEAEVPFEASPDFSAEPTVVLHDAYVGRAEAVMTAEVAYLSDHGGLSAFDLESGEELFRVEPTSAGLDAYGPEDLAEVEDLASFNVQLANLTSPQLATTQDGEVVFAAHLVELAGGLGGSLVAADAETGEVLWGIELEPESWVGAPSLASLTMREAHEGMVVVTASSGDLFMGEDSVHERFLIDIEAGEIVSELGDTLVAGHANGLLYTAERLGENVYGDLVATDPASGEEQWRLEFGDEESPSVHGPWIHLAQWNDESAAARLLHAGDRDVALGHGEGLDGSHTCDWDSATEVLVCSGGEEIVGVGASGEVAWSVPAEAGWLTIRYGNGYLYTRPDDVDLVALDVATGEVASDAVGEMPHVVGPTGVLLGGDTTVTFHAAA